MSADKAYQATEPKTLLEGLMNPNFPKSEREHFAVRIIEAADALAKALQRFYPIFNSNDGIYTSTGMIREALAAYEKVRELR